MPESLFHRPEKDTPFGMRRYGTWLATPVGVAAGPHTQLAGNIVAAWLGGARFIELKTIQTLDELEISRPCIDMQDEGYNCEWSQELRIRQSFTEYLNAWILIHLLHHELKLTGPVGTIFNMSVGYNLEGILRENVQWFFSAMNNCREELGQAIDSLIPVWPSIRNIDIPSRISGNITLSTMHGCPPEEIERIGLYLLRKKKLHTAIKLNPTLLGADDLRELLNGTLGFPTQVPDAAFHHDLKYPDAVRIIRSLSMEAKTLGLDFGVKLTNTLESLNHRNIFPPQEKMMYMSGRALHPVSIRVAEKLQNDFGGELDISFSAGVDCFNMADVLSCGLKPATVCSDLLRPGGYGRLGQYLDQLKTAFHACGATGIDDYILKTAGFASGGNVTEAALRNLRNYASRVAANEAYHRDRFTEPSIKTARTLGSFDCIHAPCTDTCPTNQEIPEYIRLLAAGNLTEAMKTVFLTNPFPSVTGMICDHPCQHKCSRINYDNPIGIREIKRFIAENAFDPVAGSPVSNVGTHLKFAIIGAGPAGLSCAWFLRMAGAEVHIFEQKPITGGMISAAIPAFRLTPEAIQKDIQRILDAGVLLHDNYMVTKENFDQILRDHDGVFLGAGAQRSVHLNIEGIGASGVMDPLDFLFRVKAGSLRRTAPSVVIIGGGNTAMDAARTAIRTTGSNGKVTIVYRRTIREMPADLGEIKAALQEGVQILELTRPDSIRTENGAVAALKCLKTVLSARGSDGRPVAVDLPDSRFEIPCDIIIPAIGQESALDFLTEDDLKITSGRYKTALPKLFTGGDALRGASTAINAIGDGRKAALEMLGNNTIPHPGDPENQLNPSHIERLLEKKAIRGHGHLPADLPRDQQPEFGLLSGTYNRDEAMAEAQRCLECDIICNTCVSVCPNLANFSYTIEPVSYRMQKAIRMPDGSIGFREVEPFVVSQPFQVLNIRDLCNECGNCTTFCPSSGKPFADKPGICLTPETLDQEGSGFHLLTESDGVRLILLDSGTRHTLALSGKIYQYETDDVSATIDATDFRILGIEFRNPHIPEIRFETAASMSIVMKGAMQLI